MKRYPFLALPLALVFAPALAATSAKAPPAEYAAYFAAVRKADAIADPLQRCLAYPDLPNNTWAPGIAKARCTMFLTPPRYTLDDIEKKLAQPNGAATLDADFSALLQAHYVDPAQREQISIAFQVFSNRDRDKAERIARAWLGAAPESPFARTALGHVLAGRGWAARGGKFARDTPAESLQKMNAYFVDAAKEYTNAMEASPKLLPACHGLMAIGRQSSNELQMYATKKCLEADPASYYVVEEMMTAAEPRWGGSDAAMQAVSAYAQAKVTTNPVLGLFAFNDEYYEIDRLDDSDAQAIAVLEPAAYKVPNAGFFRLVGGAYLRKNDTWKSLVYLSQALRFSPGYAQESRFRALALRRIGETKWARADAERAVALDPGNGLALQQLGDILREIEGPSAAAPYYKRAIADEKTQEDAYNSYCGVLLDAKQLDEAGKCIDDLLAAYPENPEGWRQRLYLIGFDAPGSKKAMERFIALNDPKRWSYHAADVKTVRLIKAGMDGTASPSEMFDARALRAKALERSVQGRPYFELLRSSKDNHLGKAIGACNSTLKAITNPQFEAVMDVQSDGRLKNVDVRPVNAWTSCVAKQVETTWKLPQPPKLIDSSTYPLIYEVRMK
ncbi:tetratricopeptide repeat protein [Solilutibacter silvestris]|uniref:tetratricopeptide repeat protein n=1 Tax=Solilutibacter silvestris TaxID=1645665 RepID=UPI0013FDC138|nr:tetratricopeptide repeat protein [Lysobacter silvestris]